MIHRLKVHLSTNIFIDVKSKPFNMYKFLTATLLPVLLLLTINRTIAQSGTYSLKDVQEYEILKVEKGQTLYGIAKSYQTSVAKLLELNPTLVDNNLKAGSTIKIPKVQLKTVDNEHKKDMKGEESQYNGIGPKPFLIPINYRVGNDETLYSIAKKTGNDVAILKLWNDLTSDLIKPGQDLVVGYGDGTFTRIPNPEGDKVFEVTTSTENAPSTDIKQKNTTIKKKGENTKNINTVNTKVPETKTEIKPTTSNSTTTSTPNTVSTTTINAPVINSPKTIPTQKEEETTETTKITTSIYDTNKRPDAKMVYLTEKGLCTYTKGNSGGNFYALHPTAPIGGTINVRNMMNNKSVQVKVIGRLPNTPENENILIKLSGSAAQELNAVDDRFLVQLSYMDYEPEKTKDKK